MVEKKAWIFKELKWKLKSEILSYDLILYKEKPYNSLFHVSTKQGPNDLTF